MTKKGYQYKECESCIYAPCGKQGEDASWCFVRFLIAELWIETKKRRRKRGEKDADDGT